MTTPRGRGRQARGPELVELARAVLVDEGLDHFVLRDIAGRAGMSVGNLQYYFPTRDDLLVAVIRAEFDRDLRALRTLTDHSDGGLAAVAHRLVHNWCDGGSNVFSVLALLAFHHDRFRDLNREIYNTFYAELAALVGAADPRADEPETAARARLITALLDGVAIQLHAAVTDGPSCDDLLARATTHVVAIARGPARS